VAEALAGWTRRVEPVAPAEVQGIGQVALFRIVDQ
jgi:hypothetical protein